MLFVDDMIGRWMNTSETKEKLNNNPNKGKRLDLDEYFKAPEEQRVLMHVLKNANYLPPAVQLMKQIKKKEEQLLRINDLQKKEELKRQIISLQREKDSLIRK